MEQAFVRGSEARLVAFVGDALVKEDKKYGGDGYDAKSEQTLVYDEARP